eukprot:355348-Chlamydomonas_euryale.AAC.1
MASEASSSLVWLTPRLSSTSGLEGSAASADDIAAIACLYGQGAVVGRSGGWKGGRGKQDELEGSAASVDDIAAIACLRDVGGSWQVAEQQRKGVRWQSICGRGRMWQGSRRGGLYSRAAGLRDGSTE